MIDFRYHLVSLVSVFLALAVGIVLGAGPLNESIDITLTDQVAQLREDRDTLRQEVERLGEGLGERDAFVAEVSPSLLSRQLGGRSVVVVALPGADDSVVQDLVELLRSAGATVSGRVSVQPSWTDPQQQPALEELVLDRLTEVGTELADGAGTSERAAALLADAVLTDQPGAGNDASASSALDALVDAGLVTVDGSPDSGATLGLVVAAGPEQADEATPESEPKVDVSAFIALVQAVEDRAAGAVVAAPRAEAGTDGDLVSALRTGVGGGAVSTVDGIATPAGRVTAVLALREQLDGGTGHYGTGVGAQALLPERAEVSGDQPGVPLRTPGPTERDGDGTTEGDGDGTTERDDDRTSEP